VIHWVDLYCGPITFQIRDRLGLKSTVTLLSRTHQTAVAVFLDGARPVSAWVRPGWVHHRPTRRLHRFAAIPRRE
jgi:hypothetical protein